ncbi:transglutaminase-like cysteine peptidase [Rhizobium sp. CECT 9324]|uniref:transglutaminase-like cysteine peptidase n=1 Tax=Rhizobium sp. CECT 9324 TaxID=2845820 RepID=UPI001E5F3E94|nr:transglutaminase-like cysteine peptidase [Rhizobium sp. CECT 9324]CAH0342861.1 hypothetical protein RHI9324_04593 [Rhizobium sp. CECT 9324]
MLTIKTKKTAGIASFLISITLTQPSIAAPSALLMSQSIQTAPSSQLFGTGVGLMPLALSATGYIQSSISSLLNQFSKVEYSKTNTASSVARTNPVSIVFVAPKTAESVGLSKPAQTDTAVFDTVAIPFKRLGALKKIGPSLAEMKSSGDFDCKSARCGPAAERISTSLGRAGSSIRDKLDAVNASVNQAIRYRKDSDIHNVLDKWSTPSETLARQQGDCEDFAILKMAMLHKLGIDLNDMSVVVLFDQKRHFYHAILSVKAGGRHYILDNMRAQVLVDTQLPNYMPLYSITAGKGYLHGSRRKGETASAVVSLDRIAPGEGAIQ